jgi:hypothetical protein
MLAVSGRGFKPKGKFRAFAIDRNKPGQNGEFDRSNRQPISSGLIKA